MAEYVQNAVQTVQPGQNVLLNESSPCCKGLVLHRAGSGIVTLRGAANKPFEKYQVTFNANVALSEGAAVGPIAVSLAIDGEPVQTSRAIVTPAAAGDYFNVTSTAVIGVPRCCCYTVAVENVSEAQGAGAAPAIDVQNANLTVTLAA